MPRIPALSAMPPSVLNAASFAADLDSDRGCSWSGAPGVHPWAAKGGLLSTIRSSRPEPAAARGQGRADFFATLVVVRERLEAEPAAVGAARERLDRLGAHACSVPSNTDMRSCCLRRGGALRRAVSIQRARGRLGPGPWVRFWDWMRRPWAERARDVSISEYVGARGGPRWNDDDFAVPLAFLADAGWG